MAFIIITKSLLMYDMDGIDKISLQHSDLHYPGVISGFHSRG
jgi:hypothetical protein